MSNRQALEKWFLAVEQEAINKVLADQYGYVMLVIGERDVSRFAKSQVRNYYTLADEIKQQPSVVASYNEWPFEPNSLDVIWLQHLSHLPKSRRGLLREAKQLLREDGSLIINALNPWRPLARRLGNSCCRMQTLVEYLETLGFYIYRVEHYGFSVKASAPYDSDNWQSRLLNACFPAFGVGYIIGARQRVMGKSSLKPTWFKAPVARTRGVEPTSYTSKRL